MSTIGLTREPTFVYPSARQFPFDEVIDQIVRALEDRNWNVPGIDVTFNVAGSGNAKERSVSQISGHDFHIRLFGDSSKTIKIPDEELSIFGDESGPDYRVLVDGKYAKYTPECRCTDMRLAHTHRGNRSPWLANNDPDAMLIPVSTQSVMESFSIWLGSHVLERILRSPAEEKVDMFSEVLVPFPDTIGPLFCFGKPQDARRVTVGKADISSLTPENQYGMRGTGYRLLPLNVRAIGATPYVVYDGFLWVGFGAVTSETPPSTLTAPGHFWSSDIETAVFRICPNRANGVFVVDNAAYENSRSNALKAARRESPRRLILTDGEVDAAKQARAETIVPVASYQPGMFADPVMLINRELDMSEVDLVLAPTDMYVR
jgi:hypothetical protein